MYPTICAACTHITTCNHNGGPVSDSTFKKSSSSAHRFQDFYMNFHPSCLFPVPLSEQVGTLGFNSVTCPIWCVICAWAAKLHKVLYAGVSQSSTASSLIRLAYSKLTLEQRCPRCCNNVKTSEAQDSRAPFAVLPPQNYNCQCFSSVKM